MNKYFFTTLLFFIFNNLFGYELKVEGLNRLDINDLQKLTNINLTQNNLSTDDINIIINDFYSSELIYDVNSTIIDDTYVITIDESKQIFEIYFNGNFRIKDEQLLSVISSKKNNLLNRNLIKSDIDIIKQSYISLGYDSINITVVTETVGLNRINLIFNLNEGFQSKITRIKFNGNKFFSDKYLLNTIQTKRVKALNLFTTGSDFNENLFQYDISKISQQYLSFGYFDPKITYQLTKLSRGKFQLEYNIDENIRSIIKNITLKNDIRAIDKELENILANYQTNLILNDRYYNSESTNQMLDRLNDVLIKNNYPNYYFQVNLKKVVTSNNEYDLIFVQSKNLLNKVNQILIEGNSITLDRAIRNKITIEPGDYIDEIKINETKKNLNTFAFINNVNSKIDKNDNLIFSIEENKKTGNLLVAGTFSSDIGPGFSIGINDTNIFGSGNEIKFNITLNSENADFDILYKQYPSYSRKIYNNYFIFNNEKDLLDSFGFKTQKTGFGLSRGILLNRYNSIETGFEFHSMRGHSNDKNYNYITDNIGTFDNFFLTINYNYDSLNDSLYPTNGFQNSLSLKVSPENISDDAFYIMNFSNKIYKNFNKIDKYLFLNNNIGITDSFNGKLKTINSFSLGGLNFKGFDYRGIGKLENGTYLGGKKYFTSSFGLGGAFLFDKKDNINFKLFSTVGSIWDNDYTNVNYKLRSSLGISMDILTVIGPVSFSFSSPILKEKDDRVREFNFQIGTSF